MAKHAPLYYATYEGPEQVVYIGEGPEQRGYPVAQTVQIGKADADRIKKQDSHKFNLEQVPVQLIGTAEENQPLDVADAHKRAKEIAEYS